MCVCVPPSRFSIIHNRFPPSTRAMNLPSRSGREHRKFGQLYTKRESKEVENEHFEIVHEVRRFVTSEELRFAKLIALPILHSSWNSATRIPIRRTEPWGARFEPAVDGSSE